jgi:pilus assembly protein CpaF
MIDRFPVSTIRLPDHGAPAKHHDVMLPEEGMKAAVTQAVPRPTQPYAGLSDKLLDAKLRLHQRLLEDTNLSALEKLSEEEIRQHVSELVAQYILTDNLSLNSQELEEFVTEVLNEMTGLGSIEPLLKDPTVGDIMINGHNCVYVERRGVL